MEKWSDFEMFYEEELRLSLMTLERQRKKILLRYFYVVGSFVFLISWGLIPFSLSQGFLSYLFFGSILNACASFFVLLFTINTRTKYRDDYKKEVVSRVVALIDPEWHYSPNMKIYILDYLKSEIFQQRYDWYDGDDLVWGKIGSTNFQCSEFQTKGKFSTAGRVVTERWQNIFKGLFFHADFNKSFSGKTFVSSEMTEKLHGQWGRQLRSHFKETKIAKLENKEFEKQFVVYTTDQIEARYILTPTIMEAFVRINKEYDYPMHFSFVGSKVYCAIFFLGKLFEPRIWRSGVNLQDVKFMYHLFHLNTTIIKELDLNTRIWTRI